MQDQEPIAADVAERRVADRQESKGTVRISVEAGEFEGRIDNISRTGVLFFSDERPRVTVEITEGGKSSTRQGQLVRVQPMTRSKSGFAVQFDEE